MTAQQYAAAELMRRWELDRSDLQNAAAELGVDPPTSTEWAAIRPT